MSSTKQKTLKLLNKLNRPEYFGYQQELLNKELNPDEDSHKDQQDCEQEQQEQEAKLRALQARIEATQRIRRKKVSIGRAIPKTNIDTPAKEKAKKGGPVSRSRGNRVRRG